MPPYNQLPSRMLAMNVHQIVASSVSFELEILYFSHVTDNFIQKYSMWSLKAWPNRLSRALPFDAFHSYFHFQLIRRSTGNHIQLCLRYIAQIGGPSYLYWSRSKYEMIKSHFIMKLFILFAFFKIFFNFQTMYWMLFFSLNCLLTITKMEKWINCLFKWHENGMKYCK